MFRARSFIGLAAPMACLAFEAQAVTFQPRLSGGYQDYDISFEDVTSSDGAGGISYRDGFEIGDRVTFIGAGLTVSEGRFFVDVSAQRSQTGRDTTFQFQGIADGSEDGTTGGNGAGQNHSLRAKFDRDEYNGTIGFAVTPDFSLYAGYKRATVDLRNTLSPSWATLDEAPDDLDVLFVGDRVIDFSYKGAFVGATYSIPVASWGGAFSIQSSVAFLDGRFKERFEGLVTIYHQLTPPFFFVEPIDPSFVNGTIKGKSRGLNLGVSWTGGFNWIARSLSNLSYTLGLDRSQYEFDTKQSTTGNFEEKNTRLRLDLRYRFTTN